MKNTNTNNSHVPLIVAEVSRFLEANPDISERSLALRAGVSPALLNRVLNRRRRDMASDKADKLRAAIEDIAAIIVPAAHDSPLP